MCIPLTFYFFFFNDTATTEIYTLSLHDALPIFGYDPERVEVLLYQLVHLTKGGELTKMSKRRGDVVFRSEEHTSESSHANISYAVFCLKKKYKKTKNEHIVIILQLTHIINTSSS